jgi:hypothetical protein
MSAQNSSAVDVRNAFLSCERLRGETELQSRPSQRPWQRLDLEYFSLWFFYFFEMSLRNLAREARARAHHGFAKLSPVAERPHSSLDRKAPDLSSQRRAATSGNLIFTKIARIFRALARDLSQIGI